MLPSSSRWVCRQQRCRNSNQVDPCVDPGCKMPVAGCGSWMLLIGCVSIFSSCRLGLFWLDGLFDSDWLFWFCLRMHPYILPSEDRGSESKIWEFVNPFRCLSPELFWMYLVENHVIFPNNVSNWQLTYHFLNFCYTSQAATATQEILCHCQCQPLFWCFGCCIWICHAAHWEDLGISKSFFTCHLSPAIGHLSPAKGHPMSHPMSRSQKPFTKMWKSPLMISDEMNRWFPAFKPEDVQLETSLSWN